MSISILRKPDLNAASGLSAGVAPKLWRLMSKLKSSKFLYLRLGSAVIVLAAMLAAIAPRMAAQERPRMKRSEDTEEKPPEPKKTKKGKDPRALGLLQLTNGGKATLIPVAILVEGKFYDATAYKADPVPMALEGGTVYEAEREGESQGLFTVNGALRSKAVNTVSPWLGTGSYLPNGTEGPKTRHKAEDVPIGMDSTSGDEPPRLTRKKESPPAADSGPSAPPQEPSPKPGTSTPSAPPASTSSAGQAPPNQDAPKPAPSPGSPNPAPKEPAPKESTPQESAPGTTPPPPSPGATPQSKTSQPQTQPQATQPQASQGEAGQPYYRPTLRRGKPTEAAPDEPETLVKETKPGSPPTAAVPPGAAVAQLVPAISDAGGPDPQSYKFFWKEGEEAERRGQMLALAANELRAYIGARAKGTIAAKAPAPQAAGRKSAAKPAQPVFENVQFHAFDVWVNNQPVMVLSAEAHLPPAPAMQSAPSADSYSITLVARTDIYGSLRKLYAGVTDKFHLDVTPRLELIDAVDADGDHRGELLFRETTDAGTGYVIFRATADKLWKMFDSLGNE